MHQKKQEQKAGNNPLQGHGPFSQEHVSSTEIELGFIIFSSLWNSWGQLPSLSQILAILPVMTALRPQARGSEMGNWMDLKKG